MVLLDVSLIGFKSQTFWGLISPVQVPRVGVLNWSTSSLLLRENFCIYEITPDVGFHAGVGVLCDIVSLSVQPVSVWPFCPSLLRSFSASFQGSLSLSLFLSGMVSYVVVDLLCPWEK